MNLTISARKWQKIFLKFLIDKPHKYASENDRRRNTVMAPAKYHAPLTRANVDSRHPNAQVG